MLVKETDISLSGDQTRAPLVAEDDYDLEDEPLVKRIKSPKTSKPSTSEPSLYEPSDLNTEVKEPLEKRKKSPKTSSPSKKQSKPSSPPRSPPIQETSSGSLRNYRKPSKPAVTKPPENNEPFPPAPSISEPSPSKPSTSEPLPSEPSTSKPFVFKPLLLNLLLSKSSSVKNTEAKEVDIDAAIKINKPSVPKPSVSIPSVSIPSTSKTLLSEPSDKNTEVKKVANDTTKLDTTIKISKRIIDTCEEDEDIPLAKKFKLNKPRLPLVIKNPVEEQPGTSIPKNAKGMKLNKPRISLVIKHPVKEQPGSNMPKNAKDMKPNPNRDAHSSFSEGVHSNKLTSKNKSRLPLVIKHPVEEQPGSSMPKNAKDMKINLKRDAHSSFSEGVHSNKQTTNKPSTPRPPPVPSLLPTASDKIIPEVKEVSTITAAVALPVQCPVTSVSSRPGRKCKSTDPYYDLETDVLLDEGPEVKEVFTTAAVVVAQSPVKSLSGRPDRKCKSTDPYYDLESDVLLNEDPEVKEVSATADVVVALPVLPSPVKSVSGRPDRKCKSTTNTLVAMLTDDPYYDLESDVLLDEEKPTSKSSKETAGNHKKNNSRVPEIKQGATKFNAKKKKKKKVKKSDVKPNENKPIVDTSVTRVSRRISRSFENPDTKSTEVTEKDATVATVPTASPSNKKSKAVSPKMKQINAVSPGSKKKKAIKVELTPTSTGNFLLYL